MADAMLENLREQSRELQHRIRTLEAEMPRLIAHNWLLKQALTMALSGLDSTVLRRRDMFDVACRSRMEIKESEETVAFFVVDIEPDEPTSDQWQPIVPGVDLGKSQSGF